MFELFKLLWDVVVLRDQARKGQMNWRVGALGFGFVVVQYCIALPAVMLYEKHPQYKPVFIIAMVVVGVNFVFMAWWAIRWWYRQSAAQKAGGMPVKPN